MKKENCIKRPKKERKSVLLTIRIKPSTSKWLRQENLSPTAIFYEAMKDLGHEQKEVE